MEKQIIFSGVTISDDDFKRLQPLLRSWTVLNEAFMMDVLTMDDLKKLMQMENMGSQREFIFRRLVTKYCSKQKDAILSRVGLDYRLPESFGSGKRGRPRKA